MYKSNFMFRGPVVSIKQHWTDEWEVLDSASGEILYLVPTRERALEEYDRMNNENEIEIDKER